MFKSALKEVSREKWKLAMESEDTESFYLMFNDPVAGTLRNI